MILRIATPRISAKSAAPLDFHDLSAIYMVVASRRDSYDNLVRTLVFSIASFRLRDAADWRCIIQQLWQCMFTSSLFQPPLRQLRLHYLEYTPPAPHHGIQALL